MGSVSGNEAHQGGLSRGEGNSQSYGTNDASSYGQTMGTSIGTQDVWGAQSPALAELYNQARTMVAGQDAGRTGRNQQGIADQARNAWAQQLTPGGNPYFEKSVQSSIDQATQGFNRNVLPELESRGV